MAAIISTARLTKGYGNARGIDDVGLSVDEGEIFGFLGPNAAGKTTIRLLIDLLRPTHGRVMVAVLDCWAEATEVKRLIGLSLSKSSSVRSLP